MLSFLRTAPAPAACAFVAGLATVGLMSHFAATPGAASGSVVKGSLQSAYEREFAAANPLAEFAIAAFGAFKYAVFRQAANGAVIGEDGWMFTAEEIETSAGFANAIQTSVDEIAIVKSALERRGVHLLTVIVPDKAEIYRDKLGFVRPRPVRERLSSFKTQLANAEIDVLDASTALCRAKSKGDVFLRDDTHWSPLGAKAVADAVADHLSGFAYARVGVETRQTGATVFDGDLLSYVPTGLFRPFVGPAQGELARYETTVANSGGLFGDSVIDIVLVGTSFSARPEWHFEGFLKQALGADVLNVAAEGRGPFAPMDALLRSDIWNAAPPKIVIWEIPARYISKDRTP